MTLEKKQELIKSATSVEELNQRMAEIEENKDEEVKGEVAEEEKDEPKEEPKAEEIAPEEERKLIRNENELFERKGETKMEKRNSKEYIDAYAEYIKSGDDTEVRSLLSTNAEGTVAVPDFVYDIVKTNWEKSDIMSRVKRISVDGKHENQL